MLEKLEQVDNVLKQIVNYGANGNGRLSEEQKANIASLSVGPILKLNNELKEDLKNLKQDLAVTQSTLA